MHNTACVLEITNWDGAVALVGPFPSEADATNWESISLMKTLPSNAFRAVRLWPPETAAARINEYLRDAGTDSE